MKREEVRFRIKIVMLLMCLAIPCVMLRLFSLQVVQHYEYAEQATRNLDRFREVVPRRGNILARDGSLLVQTAPSYDLYFQLKHVLISPDSQNPEIVYNDVCLQNLYKLLEKYHPGRTNMQKIQTNIQDEFTRASKNVSLKLREDEELRIKRPSKYKRKKKEYETDFFQRPKILERDICPELANEILYDTCYWDCDKNPVEIVNKYPGILIDYSVTRRYPEKELACHLLGNMGRIPPDTLLYLMENADYRENDYIGIYGIERVLEEALRGRRGCVVRSPQGNFIEDALDGMDVELTIHPKAQRLAEQELEQTIATLQASAISACKASPDNRKAKRRLKEVEHIGGAAVVIDIHTGEVLVMASAPGYDNNTIRRDYSLLSSDTRHPLVNRCLCRTMNTPPGSIFKVCVALYALENKVISPDFTVECKGYMFDRPSDGFRCTHSHGTTDIVKAIEGSCNIFFYHVGQKMKLPHLLRCSTQFGFDRKSGLNFPEESRPDLPKHTETGENRMFAIGQIMQATPVQVARAMAIVARRGSIPQLKIIRRFLEPSEVGYSSGKTQFLDSLISSNFSTEEIAVTPEYYDLVWKGMCLVTTGKDGTAVQSVGSLLGPYNMASKTGTSQIQIRYIIPEDEYDPTNPNAPKIERYLSDHAWFAGFAPAENPKYAFAVLIELGGYGGQVAGPIAAKILNLLLSQEN